MRVILLGPNRRHQMQVSGRRLLLLPEPLSQFVIYFSSFSLAAQQLWGQCKIPKLILLLVAVAGLIFVYKNFDPSINTNFFPKCPVKQLTGYECSGCGSQRAIHQMLNLNIRDAFFLNPLLIISIPYLLLGFVLENVSLSEKLLRIRKALYGPIAIWIVLGIVILFWIGRNL